MTAALAPFLVDPKEVPPTDDHGWQIKHHRHGMHGQFKPYAHKYRDKRVIACVRNPWDRVVSMWRFWCAPDKQHAGRTLPEFVKLLKIPHSGFSRWAYIPQKSYLDGAVNPILLRFETLRQDWGAMCEEVGLPRRKLGHRNRRPGRPVLWRAKYDDHTRDAVAALFAEDLARFGYTWDK